MPVDDNEEKPGNSALNRRNILLGGTMITAASAVVSTGHAAEGPQGPEISYFPNDNLAEAIVRAWSDADYKKDLVSKDHGTASAALAKVGVIIDKPVVLAPGELAGYKAQPGEVVFVLPDPIGKLPATLATARVAMALQARGI